MSGFFGMLATVSFIAFVVGMVKPKLVMRWAPEEKQNKSDLEMAQLSMQQSDASLMAGMAYIVSIGQKYNANDF